MPTPLYDAPVSYTHLPAPQREDANRLLPGDEVLIAAEEPAPVQGDDGKAEQIRTFLTGLMEHLHVQAVPEITLTPEGSYKVVLQGQGLGAIIGRRGETLDLSLIHISKSSSQFAFSRTGSTI